MPIAEMDPFVDNWNLMAFDYQGPGFSNFTGHLSNVYPSSTNPRATNGWNTETEDFVPFNTKEAIDHYKLNVASPSKIHLGMPLYGRSFANVIDLSKEQRGLGQKFNGSGDGTWEPGTLDYKVLPLNGSKVYTDKETLAAWSWDPVRKQMVSFDTPKIASWKTDYLMDEQLGGAWWWESSGDFPVTDDKSIVSTVSHALNRRDEISLLTNIRSLRSSVAPPTSYRTRTTCTTPSPSTTTLLALRTRPWVCFR
jgi:chitinase